MAKRGVLDVIYEDGREETLPIRPFAILATERHFKGATTAVEGTLWAAWYGIVGNKPPFDDWVGTLAAIEERQIEKGETEPGAGPLAVASAPSSSDSPPSPE